MTWPNIHMWLSSSFLANKCSIHAPRMSQNMYTPKKKSLNEWGYSLVTVLQSKVLVHSVNSVNKEITCSVTEFNKWWPHIPIIWHGLTRPVIMSLVYGMSIVTKHDKWSYKSQKRGWPYILHGHSQSHYSGTCNAVNKSEGVWDAPSWVKVIIIHVIHFSAIHVFQHLTGH